MIKNFRDYSRESGVDMEGIVKNAMENLQNYKEDETIVSISRKDTALEFTVSGIVGKPFSEGTNNVVFLVMPPTFTPNLLVNLHPSSLDVRKTLLDEYVVVSEERLREGAREMFKYCTADCPSVTTITANIIY